MQKSKKFTPSQTVKNVSLKKSEFHSIKSEISL